MYIRKTYLEWMKSYMRTPLIKVLVGMRRVGKSTLLEQFKDVVLQEEPKAQILFIDKESLKFRDITDEISFNNLVETTFSKKEGYKILFVDEVQEIKNWEKVVNSLLKGGMCDIYLTGSNAHMLSSDLSTYLTGRYVELNVFTFSYNEYLTLNKSTEHSDKFFQDYITFGGFPGLIHLPKKREILFQTLDALYNSIILKDVIKRHEIRNGALLEKITTFFFDNIGNLVTAKSIVNFLKSQHMKVSIETVQNYMEHLASCFAIYRVKRFDIKGKRFLEISEKHYLGDLGLRHAVLGYRPGDINQLLENLVFLEMQRRGYNVSIGKLGELEVDFIGEKNGERIYIQVSYLLASEKTRDREFLPLKKIKDSYPKYVVTMDTLRQSQDGIKHEFLPDFLLSNNW